jgi:hypothetical protein
MPRTSQSRPNDFATAKRFGLLAVNPNACLLCLICTVKHTFSSFKMHCNPVTRLMVTSDSGLSSSSCNRTLVRKEIQRLIVHSSNSSKDLFLDTILINQDAQVP